MITIIYGDLNGIETLGSFLLHFLSDLNVKVESHALPISQCLGLWTYLFFGWQILYYFLSVRFKQLTEARCIAL